VADWERIGPDEIARLLVALPAPWWIAGDLFLGRRTRDHEDVDVAHPDHPWRSGLELG
jgi:hypothetical protein